MNTCFPSVIAALELYPTANMTDTDRREIENWMKAQLARHLRLLPEEIDAHESPLRYGADSLTLVTIAGDLEVWLGRPLGPNVLWEYPTIASLAAALAVGTNARMSGLNRSEAYDPMDT
jgi:acyl carrier protein